MKRWVQKAIVQKIISYLPFSHKINYVFQKYVTKGVYLDDIYFYDRLGHAHDHLQGFERKTQKPAPKTCLELGTGWYPIVPVCFFLAGSEKIYSVDISFLTSKKKIITTLLKFIESNDNNSLQQYIDYLPERFDKIKNILENRETFSLDKILQELHIKYLIADARALPLPDNSIELVNSNNTFEHIPPHALIAILKEFKRILNKQNGVMSHFIDMSDHFAHFDPSINIYNFLQFTDKQWKIIDNRIQPQNRLRIYDYQKIFNDLDIPATLISKRDGDLDKLKEVKLTNKFLTNSIHDTAISHCHFISSQ